MNFHIRKGREEDIPALCEIERDAAQIFRAIGYDFAADGAIRDIEEHIRALDEGAIFVAEKDGALAGFILLWPVDGRAHITELDVAERFQKQGIGRALVDAGEAWARDNGFQEITLTTFTEVSWNAPFYRSIGYEDFTPGPDDKDLAAVQAEEARHGFHAKPRTAMKKWLGK